MADGSVLVFGEIHTGLLQHSVALSPALCEEILTLIRGDRVRRFERPIAHAVSPETLVGVDCGLAVSQGRARAVGTVTCRTSVTGGSLVQGSATVRVTQSSAGRRLPWSHYLARPGQLELIGKADTTDLAERFTAPAAPRRTLDLGAISARAVDAVQGSPWLDRRPPLRAARTRLRWAATVSDGEPAGLLRFRMEDVALRTALLTVPAADIASVMEFCADLALHDWLLTTVLRVLERSRIGTGSRSEVVRVLRPAVDHLLHLWMPAARGDETSAALWASLERRPGLGRQWRSSERRIRDQLIVSNIALLESALSGDTR
jgi:hypothetical protein